MKVSKRMSPICYLNDGRLLCYKFGSLYLLDSGTFKNIEKIVLFTSLKEKFLARVKLIFRLIRLGIRTTIQIDENIVLLYVNKRIYELNISNNAISEGYIPEPGVRALYFSNIQNINGFEDQIVFGGYLSNFMKNEVHIYKRSEVDKWDIAHTFAKGEINHVHNIIPDKHNDCVWIFTGDFDNSVAIWKATGNFGTVERVVSNHQIYRGCIGFPTEEGLIYATDTPFSGNSIRILKKSDKGWISEKICDTEGSSIYGCKFKNDYLFSTTVEPDGRDSSLKKLMFDRKRGSGIKDNYTHLYMGNMNDGFKDIFKLEKDFWPFIFQFGTIKFPAGENTSDYLIFEPVATKKSDLKLVKMKIE